MSSHNIYLRKPSFLLILTIILVGFVTSFFLGFESNVYAANSSDLNAAQQDSILTAFEKLFSAVAKRVEAGVVSITAVRSASFDGNLSNDAESSNGSYGRLLCPEYNRSPDGVSSRVVPTQSETANGSGTIIRRDGNNFYVLTNYHVVANSKSVSTGCERIFSSPPWHNTCAKTPRR